MKRIIGIPWAKKNSKGERPPKPEKPKPPGLADVVLKNDTKAEDLDKKIATCEIELKKIAASLKTVPEGSTKNALRSKATSILQRKKRFEQQVESLRQQSFNAEQASMSIDATKNVTTVVKAMKDGVKELKKAQDKVDIDTVEDLHDQLEELVEKSDDVQEALANKSNLPEIDDQELEAQLELLGEEFIADTDASYLDQANAFGGNGKTFDLSSNGFLPSNSFNGPSSGIQGIQINEEGENKNDPTMTAPDAKDNPDVNDIVYN